MNEPTASTPNPTGSDQTSAPDQRDAIAPERREGEGPDRRENRVERRTMSREQSGYTGPDRRTGLERRRGPGRRRSDERREAEEGEMNSNQFEFILAVETYKKVNKRFYPTWTEVLEVVSQLGYRKVLPRTIKMENCPESPIWTPEQEQRRRKAGTDGETKAA